jgi:hypothetical protein
MILRDYKYIKWPELRKMYRREWRSKKAIANVVKMALLGMVWGCFILFLLLYA